jgi:hypothetical protein
VIKLNSDNYSCLQASLLIGYLVLKCLMESHCSDSTTNHNTATAVSALYVVYPQPYSGILATSQNPYFFYCSGKYLTQNEHLLTN